MEHHFNIEIAKKIGIEEAIFLHNLYYWLQHNAANNKNLFDGSYWTYNTKKAYTEIFPYMSYDKIKRIINSLREEGIIKTGNYGLDKMNHTLWYAFTDCGLSMMKKAGYDTTMFYCLNRMGQNAPTEESKTNQSTTNINKTDKNNKEKTSIDIDVKNDAEASAQSDEEKYFYNYLKENCPFVYKMQVPLTYAQYKKVCTKYSREKIWETLDAMNNWKELNKKRRYAYKTLLVWLEKDKKQYT